MRLRTLLYLFGIAGFLFSSASHALGLGEITLKSQLNEPLNAEIRLLKVSDLSPAEVLVALGSRDDFERAGVDRVFFLNDLRFDVFLANPSYPYVRVTSTKVVTEPYLNFLVNVQWPSGRLVREYTLLLDLPIFNETTTAAPVQAPSRSSVQSAPSSPPAARSEPRTQSTPRPTTSAPSANSTGNTPVNRSVPADSYRIQNGDTLWEIAEKSRPSNNVSVNQTMLAIQRANPEAFGANNINLIQSGRVLRIPTESEIVQIGEAQAAQEVNTQNRVWSGQGSEPAQSAALTASTPTSTSSSSSNQPAGRLTLGSADGSGSIVRGSGSSGAGEALQNELAIAQEELDRSKRENGELQSRVSDLEAQIQTMEQLISVSSDQLRALELSLQQQEVTGLEEIAGQTPGTELTINDPALITNPDLVDPLDTDPLDIDQSLQPDSVSPSAVVVEPVEPTVSEPTPVDIPEPSAQPGLIDIIKDNLQMILAALVGLVVIIFVALRFRKSKAEDDIDDFEYAGDDNFLDDDLDVADSQMSDQAFEEPLAVNSATDDIEEEVEAETEDVIAEADIYVSLGQEDKAIELLQKEVQHNPGNAEARLGLLGIYAAAQNVEAFDDQYAQLLPLGDTYTIDQASSLREQMENATPFDTSNYSTDSLEDELDAIELEASTDNVLEDLDDLKLDDNLDGELESFSENSLETDLDELDLDLDLNLDEDIATAADTFSEASSDFSSDVSDFGDLDLDLDLDSEISLDLDGGALNESSLEDALDADSLNESTLDEIAATIEAADSDVLNELDDNLDLDLEFDGFTGDDDLDSSINLDDNVAPSLDEELESLSLSGSNDLSLDDELENIVDVNSSDGSDFETLDADTDNNLLEVESDAFDELELDEGLDDIGLDSLAGFVDDSDLVDATDVPNAKDAELAEVSTPEDLLESENDLPQDIGEVLDLDSELDESIVDDNKLSFDSPPLELDIDGLDEEIDEMTSLLDDSDLSDEDSVEEPEIEAPVKESTLESAPTSDQADEEVRFTEDDDLAFLDETDEVATKIDLARAYLDMGDREGAQDILGEVVQEGNQAQIDEAKALIKTL